MWLDKSQWLVYKKSCSTVNLPEGVGMDNYIAKVMEKKTTLPVNIPDRPIIWTYLIGPLLWT